MDIAVILFKLLSVIDVSATYLPPVVALLLIPKELGYYYYYYPSSAFPYKLLSSSNVIKLLFDYYYKICGTS